MKTEVKKLDATKRELNVEVSGDIVKNKFEDVFKKVAKDAKVPGFRPGHAPRDVLEKHYSSYVHEQVLKELVPDVYNEAITKEGLAVLQLPEISDVKLDRPKLSLSFKALVEVSPQIAVEGYKGRKVNFKKISVTPDEIKRNIDSLKESRKIDTIDDSFAKGLGYPNLSELEQAIGRQIFLQKENHERQRIENEIVDNITQGLDFPLPRALINRQLEDEVRKANLDLALKGVPRDKIDEGQGAISAQLEPEVKRQVKVYNMPRRVMELLLREADWSIIDA
ncbi:MAG: trigger factor [Candidatus Omnitrophica bacterium]|nr:trigger factor [Candidatus Omnitrophota bacterium]